jgi:hypothetical protein
MTLRFAEMIRLVLTNSMKETSRAGPVRHLFRWNNIRYLSNQHLPETRDKLYYGQCYRILHENIAVKSLLFDKY